LTTDPLKALVVGAFVRGLSMRDVEALCEEAGLGQISEIVRLVRADAPAAGWNRDGDRFGI
jgi:hypothetical protein